MSDELTAVLEEAGNDTYLSLTDVGEARWKELQIKGFVNCSTTEMCQWNILFDMHDTDTRRKETASLWSILGPGNDSALGRFLAKNTEKRMSWVLKNLEPMIEAGLLTLERKK